MFVLARGGLVEEATGYPVHLERVLGLYSIKYFYILTGRGKISFHEEINKTYQRREENILYKDLPEGVQNLLMEVLLSFDKDAERRRAFWQ